MKASTKRTQPPVGHKLFRTGRVSAKGWVVIPKELRDQMGLNPGDEVQFSITPPLPNMKQDKALNVLNIIRIPEDPLSVVSGMFIRRPGEPLWTENLLKERRAEVEKEEREMRARRRRRQPSA